ncbi:MAG: sulfate ABC transporter substrate-binding protein, partial [Synergistaceae bacterium]|nr:sulfate ABC transporter substrate-binding protein [Synergistaceae bacterium]
PGVGIITPNPKTSGGARWNYLAAWAYAQKLYNGNAEKVKAFIGDVFANVLVLDSGARGSTTTFVENGQGDVLLAWENEAYLSIKEHGDAFEIVTPPLSILAEPPVAIVDDNVDKKGTRDVARAYLEYLYTDIGQKIAGDNFYRPTNPEILAKYSNVFDLDVNLITIDDPLFGGWDKAQTEHFADGGIFDQIYEK